MIQLHADFLAFSGDNGEAFPCSIDEISVELIGKKASQIDPEIIQQAAKAILHYYRHELGRTTVTKAEFAAALVKVLLKLGVQIEGLDEQKPPGSVIELNLAGLIEASSCNYELAFFPRLRAELQTQLRSVPQMIRFTGLRSCVKLLIGVKRWNEHCRFLEDQIVLYLRQCYQQEAGTVSAVLVVE